MTEGQKRRALAPYIRAASNCIAQRTLIDGRIVDAFRSLDMTPVISTAAQGCLNELARVAGEHDRLHGTGTGIVFVRGAYWEDLPRAVNVRIRDEVTRRIAAFEQAEADRRVADAQAEARRREQQELAEAQRRETQARLDKLANDTRDVAYQCTDGGIGKLVRSAEAAETLATAVMIVCRNDISNALEARIDTWNFARGGQMTDTVIRSWREDIRKVMRDNVITSAVRFKAALNTPSAPVPSPVPSAPAPPRTVPAAVQSAKPSVSPAVSTCLETMNTVQQGKFVGRDDLVQAMMDLCRPEIEGMARERFLADMSITLDRHREIAVVAAKVAAATVVDGGK